MSPTSERISTILANPNPHDEASAARGKKLFDTRCTACHGKDGHGNGTLSKVFPPAPDLCFEFDPPPLRWLPLRHVDARRPRHAVAEGRPHPARPLGRRELHPQVAGGHTSGTTARRRHAVTPTPPKSKPVWLALSVVGAVLAAWPLFGSAQAGCWGAILASWLFGTGVALGCVALSFRSQAHPGSPTPAGPTRCRRARPASSRCCCGASWSWWRWWPRVRAGCRGWATRGPSASGFSITRASRSASWPRRRSCSGWRASRPARPSAAAPRRWASSLSLAFVLTLWSVDFVMALDPDWANPVLGTYYFMGSLLGGVALLAFANGRRKESGDLRHDSRHDALRAGNVLGKPHLCPDAGHLVRGPAGGDRFSAPPHGLSLVAARGWHASR